MEIESKEGEPSCHRAGERSQMCSLVSFASEWLVLKLERMSSVGGLSIEVPNFARSIPGWRFWLRESRKQNCQLLFEQSDFGLLGRNPFARGRNGPKLM